MSTELKSRGLPAHTFWSDFVINNHKLFVFHCIITLFCRLVNFAYISFKMFPLRWTESTCNLVTL